MSKLLRWFIIGSILDLIIFLVLYFIFGFVIKFNPILMIIVLGIFIARFVVKIGKVKNNEIENK